MRLASIRKRLTVVLAATALAAVATPLPTAGAGVLPPCAFYWITTTLSGLSVSGASLSPVFAAGTYDYSATLPNGTASTQVTASATYANFRLSYSTGGAFTNLSSGVPSAAIPVGPGTTKSITVRAGNTVDDCVVDYTINVDRAAGDARLASLGFSPGGLSPAFASNVTSYTASVASSVASVLVTPTTLAGDSTIQMSVGGGAFVGIPSGFASAAAIPAGTTTTIVLKVTAADGSTTVNYSITVSRGSTAPTLITIPNVKGLKLKAAKAALRAAGFSNFRVIYLYSATVPKNRVVKTTTGQRVADALITIKVSKGPRP